METMTPSDALDDDIFSGLGDGPELTEARTVEIIEIPGDIAFCRLADGRVGTLPVTEYPSTRRWRVGERLVVLASADTEPHLSVCDPQLVPAMAATFVPELRDGTVRVMGVARAPGSRTKMAVATTDTSVDPVAACVGRKASRIRALCDALNERVDVVAWRDDPLERVASAMAPAKVISARFNGTDEVVCSVAPHQMAAAVGERGLNSALAGQLAGVSVAVVAAEGDSGS
jgi:N utilization substance protein A